MPHLNSLQACGSVTDTAQGKGTGLEGKEKAALTLRGLVVGGTALLPSIIQGRLAMSTCQRGINPPPPRVLLRADSHQSTQQCELSKRELRGGSMKKGQMLPWGQAARGPSVSPPPSPPLASPLLLPLPPTPPAGAQAGAASV